MSVFQKLLLLLPILAQLKTDNKNVQLALDLIKIAEDEIERRMNEQGRTRAEILADASETWDAAITGADELAKLGHGSQE